MKVEIVFGNWFFCVKELKFNVDKFSALILIFSSFELSGLIHWLLRKQIRFEMAGSIAGNKVNIRLIKK